MSCPARTRSCGPLRKYWFDNSGGTRSQLSLQCKMGTSPKFSWLRILSVCVTSCYTLSIYERENGSGIWWALLIACSWDVSVRVRDDSWLPMALTSLEGRTKRHKQHPRQMKMNIDYFETWFFVVIFGYRVGRDSKRKLSENIARGSLVLEDITRFSTLLQTF